MSKKALFEIVAEKLIEDMKKGVSPFQMPWNSDASYAKPFNPITDKAYRGINSVWLMMQGFQDPRWMTFKQAQSKGWMVEKGAKASVINFYKFHKEEIKKDENGKIVLDEKGNMTKQIIALKNPIITSAHVFNASQIRGIEPLIIDQTQKWNEHKRVDKVVKNSGVVIEHGGNQAYYSPMNDKITMPKKAQFDDAGKYYSTLLHELGHWTGHETRLNRPILNKFGTEDYAKEELRAEVASLMLGGEFKVGRDYSQHLSYIDSWIKVLEKDPFELYKASADAQKIMDYVMNFEQKRAIEQKKSFEKVSLNIDDKIRYNNEDWKVTGLLPNKKLHLTNLDSGRSVRIAPDDNLYLKLLEAKQSALETDKTVDKAINEEQTQNIKFKR